MKHTSPKYVTTISLCAVILLSIFSTQVYCQSKTQRHYSFSLLGTSYQLSENDVVNNVSMGSANTGPFLEASYAYWLMKYNYISLGISGGETWNTLHYNDAQRQLYELLVDIPLIYHIRTEENPINGIQFEFGVGLYLSNVTTQQIDVIGTSSELNEQTKSNGLFAYHKLGGIVDLGIIVPVESSFDAALGIELKTDFTYFGGNDNIPYRVKRRFFSFYLRFLF